MTHDMCAVHMDMHATAHLTSHLSAVSYTNSFTRFGVKRVLHASMHFPPCERATPASPCRLQPIVRRDRFFEARHQLPLLALRRQPALRELGPEIRNRQAQRHYRGSHRRRRRRRRRRSRLRLFLGSQGYTRWLHSVVTLGGYTRWLHSEVPLSRLAAHAAHARTRPAPSECRSVSRASPRAPPPSPRARRASS